MKYFYIAIAFFLTHSVAMAQPDVEIKAPITQVIQKKSSASQSKHALQQDAPKTVTLLGVKLSKKAWRTLSKDAQSIPAPTPRPPDPPTFSSRTETQLGMNQVPVLDQGQHGTCATFAVTAALDAALNKGDYISQLCSLQLGESIAQYSYRPSGWDGSTIAFVLNQVDSFGLINKTTQQSTGCGGLTTYAEAPSTPATTMTLPEHYAMSEVLPDDISSTQILDYDQKFQDHFNPQKTLDAVKNTLRNNDRLAFGVLLIGLDQGQVGAVGSHHETNDTWLLTPEVLLSLAAEKNYGGHAMISTGFDDFATATDSHGQVHQGLLTIRNSWGPLAGDQGNFYMTYSYFKLLAMEVVRIRTLKPSFL